MVSIKMGVGKSLICQVMPLINSGAIILTIIPSIVLIEDQKRELRQKNASILVLIAAVVKTDSNIWKKQEQKEYSVIFISPKIVFTL